MTTPVIAGGTSSVLIVDECPVVRYGIRHILAHQCHCGTIVESCGSDALEHLRRRRWSGVILGISIPDGGLELLKDMVHAAAFTRVVLLGSLPEPGYASKALDAGASGYLTKQDSVPELVTGFRNVLAGRSYVSSSINKVLRSEPRKRLPHESLSKRERTVFLGIAAGKRLSQMAEELKVHAKTVSTYRRRILQKMGMVSNAELISYALRHISQAGSNR